VQVFLPSGRECWARAYDVMDFEEWTRTREATQQALIATARRFLGTPYLWGGASAKHFDCSGFTQFVYRQSGIVLPRNAREQIHTGEEIPYDFDRMQPGDLIFYGTPATAKKKMVVAHVAMYLGDKKIIHSSQLVRINSLTPDGEDYYERSNPLGVRRILGHVDEPGSGIRSVAAHLKQRCTEYGLKLPFFLMEPGRSIVADAGMTVYTVSSVKRIPGYKYYVVIDGGMTDNPRYPLYGAPYTVLHADREAQFYAVYDLAGRCCESGDIIQPAVKLPIDTQRGDHIAVCTTGAYNYSMASNYNRLPRPPVVMLTEEGSRLAVRRETLEDLVALDQ